MILFCTSQASAAGAPSNSGSTATLPSVVELVRAGAAEPPRSFAFWEGYQKKREKEFQAYKEAEEKLLAEKARAVKAQSDEVAAQAAALTAYAEQVENGKHTYYYTRTLTHMLHMSMRTTRRSHYHMRTRIYKFTFAFKQTPSTSSLL